MNRSLLLSAVLALLAAAPLPARELGAHVHGAGTLDIAIEGGELLMELRAPGADIVGFEHAADTPEARARLDAAIATLEQPLTIFALPEAAGCVVTAADVAGAASAEADHDDHDHEKHDDHDHETAEHDDHDGHEQQEHMEFHASYSFSCAAPDKLTGIGFPYFTRFDGAEKLTIQIVTATGATGAEVTRAAPQLDLRGLR